MIIGCGLVGDNRRKKILWSSSTSVRYSKSVSCFVGGELLAGENEFLFFKVDLG